MKLPSPHELLELWERGSRLHPLDQGLLALRAGLPDGSPEIVADWRANVRSAFEELLPHLVFVALPTLVSGPYDVTPDHQAILGRVRDRVWVAAGFSGHGFMLAPAVGRIIAESVLGESEDPVLSVLDAGRFAAGRLVPEPEVV